jgi:hypothetical protein
VFEPETVPMVISGPVHPGGAFGTSRRQLSRARSKAARPGVFVIFVRLNIGVMMAR